MSLSSYLEDLSQALPLTSRPHLVSEAVGVLTSHAAPVVKPSAAAQPSPLFGALSTRQERAGAISLLRAFGNSAGSNQHQKCSVVEGVLSSVVARYGRLSDGYLHAVAAAAAQAGKVDDAESELQSVFSSGLSALIDRALVGLESAARERRGGRGDADGSNHGQSRSSTKLSKALAVLAGGALENEQGFQRIIPLPERLSFGERSLQLVSALGALSQLSTSAASTSSDTDLQAHCDLLATAQAMAVLFCKACCGLGAVGVRVRAVDGRASTDLVSRLSAASQGLLSEADAEMDAADTASSSGNKVTLVIAAVHALAHCATATVSRSASAAGGRFQGAKRGAGGGLSSGSGTENDDDDGTERSLASREAACYRLVRLVKRIAQRLDNRLGALACSACPSDAATKAMRDDQRLLQATVASLVSVAGLSAAGAPHAASSAAPAIAGRYRSLLTSAMEAVRDALSLFLNRPSTANNLLAAASSAAAQSFGLAVPSSVASSTRGGGLASSAASSSATGGFSSPFNPGLGPALAAASASKPRGGSLALRSAAAVSNMFSSSASASSSSNAAAASASRSAGSASGMKLGRTPSLSSSPADLLVPASSSASATAAVFSNEQAARQMSIVASSHHTLRSEAKAALAGALAALASLETGKGDRTVLARLKLQLQPQMIGNSITLLPQRDLLFLRLMAHRHGHSSDGLGLVVAGGGGAGGSTTAAALLQQTQELTAALAVWRQAAAAFISSGCAMALQQTQLASAGGAIGTGQGGPSLVVDAGSGAISLAGGSGVGPASSASSLTAMVADAERGIESLRRLQVGAVSAAASVCEVVISISSLASAVDAADVTRQTLDALVDAFLSERAWCGAQAAAVHRAAVSTNCEAALHLQATGYRERTGNPFVAFLYHGHGGSPYSRLGAGVMGPAGGVGGSRRSVGSGGGRRGSSKRGFGGLFGGGAAASGTTAGDSSAQRSGGGFFSRLFGGAPGANKAASLPPIAESRKAVPSSSSGLGYPASSSTTVSQQGSSTNDLKIPLHVAVLERLASAVPTVLRHLVQTTAQLAVTRTSCLAPQGGGLSSVAEIMLAVPPAYAANIEPTAALDDVAALGIAPAALTTLASGCRATAAEAVAAASRAQAIVVRLVEVGATTGAKQAMAQPHRHQHTSLLQSASRLSKRLSSEAETLASRMDELRSKMLTVFAQAAVEVARKDTLEAASAPSSSSSSAVIAAVAAVSSSSLGRGSAVGNDDNDDATAYTGDENDEEDDTATTMTGADDGASAEQEEQGNRLAAGIASGAAAAASGRLDGPRFAASSEVLRAMLPALASAMVPLSRAATSATAAGGNSSEYADFLSLKAPLQSVRLYRALWVYLLLSGSCLPSSSFLVHPTIVKAVRVIARYSPVLVASMNASSFFDGDITSGSPLLPAGLWPSERTVSDMRESLVRQLSPQAASTAGPSNASASGGAQEYYLLGGLGSGAGATSSGLLREVIRSLSLPHLLFVRTVCALETTRASTPAGCKAVFYYLQDPSVERERLGWVMTAVADVCFSVFAARASKASRGPSRDAVLRDHALCFLAHCGHRYPRVRNAAYRYLVELIERFPSLLWDETLLGALLKGLDVLAFRAKRGQDAAPFINERLSAPGVAKSPLGGQDPYAESNPLHFIYSTSDGPGAAGVSSYPMQAPSSQNDLADVLSDWAELASQWLLRAMAACPLETRALFQERIRRLSTGRRAAGGGESAGTAASSALVHGAFYSAGQQSAEPIIRPFGMLRRLRQAAAVLAPRISFGVNGSAFNQVLAPPPSTSALLLATGGASAMPAGDTSSTQGSAAPSATSLIHALAPTEAKLRWGTAASSLTTGPTVAGGSAAAQATNALVPVSAADAGVASPTASSSAGAGSGIATDPGSLSSSSALALPPSGMTPVMAASVSSSGASVALSIATSTGSATFASSSAGAPPPFPIVSDSAVFASPPGSAAQLTHHQQLQQQPGLVSVGGSSDLGASNSLAALGGFYGTLWGTTSLAAALVSTASTAGAIASGGLPASGSFLSRIAAGAGGSTLGSSSSAAASKGMADDTVSVRSGRSRWSGNGSLAPYPQRSDLSAGPHYSTQAIALAVATASAGLVFGGASSLTAAVLALQPGFADRSLPSSAPVGYGIDGSAGAGAAGTSGGSNVSAGTLGTLGSSDPLTALSSTFASSLEASSEKRARYMGQIEGMSHFHAHTPGNQSARPFDAVMRSSLSTSLSSLLSTSHTKWREECVRASGQTASAALNGSGESSSSSAAAEVNDAIGLLPLDAIPALAHQALVSGGLGQGRAGRASTAVSANNRSGYKLGRAKGSTAMLVGGGAAYDDEEEEVTDRRGGPGNGNRGSGRRSVAFSSDARASKSQYNPSASTSSMPSELDDSSALSDGDKDVVDDDDDDDDIFFGAVAEEEARLQRLEAGYYRRDSSNKAGSRGAAKAKRGLSAPNRSFSGYNQPVVATNASSAADAAAVKQSRNSLLRIITTGRLGAASSKGNVRRSTSAAPAIASMVALEEPEAPTLAGLSPRKSSLRLPASVKRLFRVSSQQSAVAARPQAQGAVPPPPPPPPPGHIASSANTSITTTAEAETSVEAVATRLERPLSPGKRVASARQRAQHVPSLVAPSAATSASASAATTERPLASAGTDRTPVVSSQERLAASGVRSLFRHWKRFLLEKRRQLSDLDGELETGLFRATAFLAWLCSSASDDGATSTASNSAAALSTAASELIPLVVWLPVRAFTVPALEAAVECWSWLCSCLPSHLRLALLHEISAAWAWTASNRFGVFSGDAHRRVEAANPATSAAVPTASAAPPSVAPLSSAVVTLPPDILSPPSSSDSAADKPVGSQQEAASAKRIGGAACHAPLSSAVLPAGLIDARPHAVMLHFLLKQLAVSRLRSSEESAVFTAIAEASVADSSRVTLNPAAFGVRIRLLHFCSLAMAAAHSPFHLRPSGGNRAGALAGGFDAGDDPVLLLTSMALGGNSSGVDSASQALDSLAGDSAGQKPVKQPLPAPEVTGHVATEEAAFDYGGPSKGDNDRDLLTAADVSAYFAFSHASQPRDLCFPVGHFASDAPGTSVYGIVLAPLLASVTPLPVVQASSPLSGHEGEEEHNPLLGSTESGEKASTPQQESEASVSASAPADVGAASTSALIAWNQERWLAHSQSPASLALLRERFYRCLLSWFELPPCYYQVSLSSLPSLDGSVSEEAVRKDWVYLVALCRSLQADAVIAAVSGASADGAAASSSSALAGYRARGTSGMTTRSVRSTSISNMPMGPPQFPGPRQSRSSSSALQAAQAQAPALWPPRSRSASAIVSAGAAPAPASLRVPSTSVFTLRGGAPAPGRHQHQHQHRRGDDSGAASSSSPTTPPLVVLRAPTFRSRTRMRAQGEPQLPLAAGVEVEAKGTGKAAKADHALGAGASWLSSARFLTEGSLAAASRLIRQLGAAAAPGTAGIGHSPVDQGLRGDIDVDYDDHGALAAHRDSSVAPLVSGPLDLSAVALIFPEDTGAAATVESGADCTALGPSASPAISIGAAQSSAAPSLSSRDLRELSLLLLTHEMDRINAWYNPTLAEEKRLPLERDYSFDARIRLMAAYAHAAQTSGGAGAPQLGQQQAGPGGLLVDEGVGSSLVSDHSGGQCPTPSVLGRHEWARHVIAAWAVSPHLAVALWKRFKRIPEISAPLQALVQSDPAALRDDPEAVLLLVTSESVSQNHPALASLALWAPASFVTVLTLLSRCSAREGIPPQGVRGEGFGSRTRPKAVPLSAHYHVAAYIVRCLRRFSPDTVVFYLPQLVQSLRHDVSGQLADFLFSTSQSSMLVAHQLIWLLVSESRHDDEGAEGEGHHHKKKAALEPPPADIRAVVSELKVPKSSAAAASASTGASQASAGLSSSAGNDDVRAAATSAATASVLAHGHGFQKQLPGVDTLPAKAAALAERIIGTFPPTARALFELQYSFWDSITNISTRLKMEVPADPALRRQAIKTFLKDLQKASEHDAVIARQRVRREARSQIRALKGSSSSSSTGTGGVVGNNTAGKQDGLIINTGPSPVGASPSDGAAESAQTVAAASSSLSPSNVTAAGPSGGGGGSIGASGGGGGGIISPPSKRSIPLAGAVSVLGGRLKLTELEMKEALGNTANSIGAAMGEDDDLGGYASSSGIATGAGAGGAGEEAKAVEALELLQSAEIITDIYMPTNPRLKVVSVDLDSGRPMQSAAKCPFLLTFTVTEGYEGPDATLKRAERREERRRRLQARMSSHARGKALSFALQLSRRDTAMLKRAKVAAKHAASQLRSNLQARSLQMGRSLARTRKQVNDAITTSLARTASMGMNTTSGGLAGASTGEGGKSMMSKLARSFRQQSSSSSSHQHSSTGGSGGSSSSYAPVTVLSPISEGSAPTASASASASALSATAVSAPSSPVAKRVLPPPVPSHELVLLDGEVEGAAAVDVEDDNNDEVEGEADAGPADYSDAERYRDRASSEEEAHEPHGGETQASHPIDAAPKAAAPAMKRGYTLYNALRRQQQGGGQRASKQASSSSTTPYADAVAEEVDAAMQREREQQSSANGTSGLAGSSASGKRKTNAGSNRSAAAALLLGVGGGSSNRRRTNSRGIDAGLPMATSSGRLPRTMPPAGYTKAELDRGAALARTVKTSLILKCFDDCRQDSLVMQVMTLMKHVCDQSRVGTLFYPYRIIPTRTGSRRAVGGILECIPDVRSRDELGKAGFRTLYEWFLSAFGRDDGLEFEAARRNFVRSLAASAIVCYLMWIKDRHNGNLLVTSTGSLIHIDFGFILGRSPGGDLGFENAAWKFTQEYLAIMGGSIEGEAFGSFVELVARSYLLARDNSEAIQALVECFADSGLPCFHFPDALTKLNTRLQPLASDLHACGFIKALSLDAVNKSTTLLYDGIQKLQNNLHSETWQ